MDDGSRDKTLEKIIEYTKEVLCEGRIIVRGLQCKLNCGKGAAVKYVRTNVTYSGKFVCKGQVGLVC